MASAFDQSAFMIAIGFASGAVAITTIVLWMGARKYAFLLSWGGGLAFCVPGVAMLGALLNPYNPTINCIAFACLLTGVVFIESSGRQFRSGRFSLAISLAFWLASVATMGAAFALGLSGIGVVILNFWCGVFLASTAVEFWRARREAPVAVALVVALYLILAISFFLCMVPLLLNHQFVLRHRQENWAEDVNSACVIVAIAGIGAIMLVLAQTRSTQAQHRAAMSDPLTGLFNRRALFERGTAAAPGSAAIMFDLDHFKRINDRFGHACGDEVLVRFAQVIASAIRPGDMAARLGGEEFCVLLGAGPPAAAADVAERIRTLLAASAPLAPDFGAPIVSAGIGLKARPDDTFEDMLRSADRALYEAKSAGRNRVQGPMPRLAA